MEPAAILDPAGPLPAPASARGNRAATAWRLLQAGWPAAVASALLLTLVAITVRNVKANEHGRFVYPIDDIYLHMSIARNLLQHGTWGVSHLSGFSFCSSSLLWPTLLAATFAVFGVHESYPFVLNVLAAVGALFYMGWMLRRTTGSPLLGLLVLVVIVVFTPLIGVAATGMEHCVQILACVVFVDLAARVLTADAQRLASRSADFWLCAAGLGMTVTRYEGLFLVAPVGLLLLCQRRWLMAVGLGLVAVLPVILGGLVAASKGWYFLPSSLMLKGNMNFEHTLAGLLTYLGKWHEMMMTEPGHMFVLLTATTAALIGSLLHRRLLWSYPSLFLFITVLGFLQHLQFAGLGWFFRYEAYLIVLALLGLGIALGYELPEDGQRPWLSGHTLPLSAALLLAAGLFGLPLWLRAVPAMRYVVTASYNVYEQQYQMGHFIRRYYQGKGVAANDAGAIDFFADINLLDTVGLTDIDVLRARRAGTFDHARFQQLMQKHQVELIMIYDDWANMFGGVLPGWVHVGQWRIPHNTVVGSDTVSFYAPNSKLAPKIMQQLREFSSSLPSDVEQEGLYLGTHPTQVTGTFPAEGDKNATVYWTNAWAQFAVYPASDEPLDSDATTLPLAVLPISGGQIIEVFFNGQLVETRQIPPEGFSRWFRFPVKAKWQPGANTVKLIGHGTTVKPPGDARSLLFMVLDPRQQMDDAGKVTPRQP